MTTPDLRRAMALCKAAGNRNVPVPMSIVRSILKGDHMPTKTIGRAKLKKTVTGKTKVEPVKARTSVSSKIGAEKKAKRAVKALEKAAPGRVKLTRKGAR